MKSTGIVRRIDPLGRIVLPMELRRVLGVQEKDPMEIFIDGEQIILTKYNGSSCTFCGAADDVTTFKKKNVCATCIDEMHSKIS